MGDSRTRRTFALCPVYIDVNPLLIAGTVGERIESSSIR